MRTRAPLCLLTLLLAAVPGSAARAESFAGSLSFSTGAVVGEIHFTALAPGDTFSGFAPFSGYSQAASGDYTYLYRVDNDSTAGTETPFGNEHSFIGVELLTLLDPTNAALIHSVGFDSGNSGEEPSFFLTHSTDPQRVDYEFDNGPNFGIVPEGGFSAWLLFRSPFGPGSGGGLIITNNTNPPNNFAEVLSGVTTPVPEPGSAALLLGALVALAARRPAIR